MHRRFGCSPQTKTVLAWMWVDLRVLSRMLMHWQDVYIIMFKAGFDNT